MIIFIDRLEYLHTPSRESLLKDRYDWPPCTTSFRLAAFKLKKYIFFFFTKQVILTRRSTVLSLPFSKSSLHQKWSSETFLLVSRIGGRTWYFFVISPSSNDPWLACRLTGAEQKVKGSNPEGTKSSHLQ